MNNRRRKELRSIQLDLQVLEDHVSSWKDFVDAEGPRRVNEAEAHVQLLIDEETDYAENLSDAAQEGERGMKAQEAIDLMEEARGSLELLLDLDADGFDLHEVEDMLFNAIANLDLAAAD